MDLFAFAAQRRDQGMQAAADAQNSKEVGFTDRAYEVIRGIALKQPTVHIDDFLAVSDLKPDHPNAFGAPWMRAIRNGVLERTGTIAPCKRDPKKHGHNYPIYRSKIYTPEG